jgi:hypothetical protein
MAQFKAALDTRRYHDAVMAEYAAAESLGVDGTPTVFINGQPVVGSRSEQDFDRIIDAHLQSAQNAFAHGVAHAELYPILMSMAKGEDVADPSAVPTSNAVHIEMRALDRVRSVAAACRRHDASRAKVLSAPLTGALKQRALDICTGEGVDLP